MIHIDMKCTKDDIPDLDDLFEEILTLRCRFQKSQNTDVDKFKEDMKAIEELYRDCQ